MALAQVLKYNSTSRTTLNAKKQSTVSVVLGKMWKLNSINIGRQLCCQTVKTSSLFKSEKSSNLINKNVCERLIGQLWHSRISSQQVAKLRRVIPHEAFRSELT